MVAAADFERCLMKVISGSVNSWLVSLIISIASASGSRPSVERGAVGLTADPWGVDECEAVLQQRLGAVISTRSTSRPPACGARRRSLCTSSAGSR